VAADEARVRELEASLADPSLYDGSGDKARLARGLQKELADAQRAHDSAVAAWAAAVDVLEQIRG
jgi:hypothetical protein